MRSHVRGWGLGAQERVICTPSTFCGLWLGFDNPRYQSHLHHEFSVSWTNKQASLNLSLFVCEMDYTYPSSKVERSKKGHSAFRGRAVLALSVADLLQTTVCYLLPDPSRETHWQPSPMMDIRGVTQTHYAKQKRGDRGKGDLRDTGIEWN